MRNWVSGALSALCMSVFTAQTLSWVERKQDAHIEDLNLQASVLYERVKHKHDLVQDPYADMARLYYIVEEWVQKAEEFCAEESADLHQTGEAVDRVLKNLARDADAQDSAKMLEALKKLEDHGITILIKDEEMREYLLHLRFSILINNFQFFRDSKVLLLNGGMLSALHFLTHERFIDLVDHLAASDFKTSDPVFGHITVSSPMERQYETQQYVYGEPGQTVPLDYNDPDISIFAPLLGSPC